MKEKKKIYNDLKNHSFSIIHFEESPYIELMVYGDYSIDMFDENSIKVNNKNIVTIFLLNYN